MDARRLRENSCQTIVAFSPFPSICEDVHAHKPEWLDHSYDIAHAASDDDFVNAILYVAKKNSLKSIPVDSPLHVLYKNSPPEDDESMAIAEYLALSIALALGRNGIIEIFRRTNKRSRPRTEKETQEVAIALSNAITPDRKALMVLYYYSLFD